jgi:DNA topoisomerase-1
MDRSIPRHDFEMKWEVASDSKKHVKAIADALKDDNALILATDPDREGEAISWHLQGGADGKRKSIKKDTPVSRVTFNAITKAAVTEAMAEPPQVDMELVEAYLARRALDYLVGFNLSPRALAQAAGAQIRRARAIGLPAPDRRARDGDRGVPPANTGRSRRELATPRGQEFEARLTVLAGKKLDKFDIGNETQAELAVQAITSRDLTVQSRSRPNPPTATPRPRS